MNDELTDCKPPHRQGYLCLDCATDDQVLASLPEPLGPLWGEPDRPEVTSCPHEDVLQERRARGVVWCWCRDCDSRWERA